MRAQKVYASGDLNPVKQAEPGFDGRQVLPLPK